MYKPIRSAELVSGGNVVKQGEYFTLTYQLFDEDGQVVNIAGNTITVKIANNYGVVFESNANILTSGQISFKVDDDIGYGEMRIELTVTNGTTIVQKYPSDGWIKLDVTPSLDDLGYGGVNTVTVASLKNELTQMQNAYKLVVDAEVGEIEGKATEALIRATSAKVTAETVQGEFDRVVAESGSNNPEVVQARGSEATLKARLDKTTAQLADIAYLSTSFKQAGDIDDTASINRALAHVNSLGGGKVRIPYKNTPYIISDELLIHSNTTLEVDTYAVIKLANAANKIMMGNANKSTVSNHTITDKNIKITGGIWDGNRSGQTLKWYGAMRETPLIVAFHFSGVENMEFSPTKIINARTYGCLVCNFKNVDIRNIEISVGDMTKPDNGDGIHIMGPGSRLLIENIQVKSEDHAIAINCDDVKHGNWSTTGSVNDVVIQNITLKNDDGGQGINLLSGVSSLKDVIIRDIKGKASYLLGMHTFDMGAGDYDNILIENTNVEKIGATQYEYIHMFGKYGKVQFRNINIPNKTGLTVTNRIKIKTTVKTPVTTFDELIFDGLTINDVNIAGQKFWGYINISAGVSINILRLLNFRSERNITPIIPLDLASARISKLIIDNPIVDNAIYGMGYFNDMDIDDVQIRDMKLGTKSNNVFYNLQSTGKRIKKLMYINSGLPFIRLPQHIDSFNVDNPVRNLRNDDSYYHVGQVVFRNDNITDYAAWICTGSGSRYNTTWQANTAYKVDDLVRIGSWLLKCINAGTSGATTPTVTDSDFQDGTVTWRYLHNGVAIFKPFGNLTP